MIVSAIFLIPNGTFVFELVLFIIVLGIVAKFILPSIQQAMDEREGKVRGALEASDEGRHEADRLASERARVLEQARGEARSLLEEANATADRAKEDAHRRGETAHEQIVGTARAAIDSERAAIRDELIGGLDALVVAAAERVIGAQVDATRHREIIERARATARAEVE